MALHLPQRKPEEMSPAAQKYLRAAAYRHLVVGGFFICAPQFFSADVYRRIEKLLPLDSLAIWGVVSILVGGTCMWAALSRAEWWAWRGLLGSFVVTILMATAYLEAWVDSHTPAPVVTVCLLALARKDFIQLAIPLRAPFEPVVEEYADDCFFARASEPEIGTSADPGR